jgi:hypothetical protein
MRGFILPKYYKSGLRMTLHHALPGTTTFIALKDKQVIATASIMPDSELGLPMDMGYEEEADGLRRAGRKICEGGYLAIDTEVFGRGLFSMFNFDKLKFMFVLFKFLFQYALYRARLDDICIVTNPQYMIFKFLPFETIGPVKYYGYDRVAIKKKAAVAKQMDLHQIDGWSTKRVVLRKMFLDHRLPEKAFADKYQFTINDLRYFFVEKSDVFKTATKHQRDYIASCYGLSAEALEKMCEGV